MDGQTLLLVIIGVILLVAVLLLLGGPVAMGGMGMMAGMMATPIGWIVLLIILALVGFLGYAVFFAH